MTANKQTIAMQKFMQISICAQEHKTAVYLDMSSPKK